MAEFGCFKTWTQESWQDTVGSSWRKHAAAYTEATGKAEDQGVCAILSCTKSPLRLEWSNSVCLGSIVWNLLLEIGTYALSFKRLHTDQSFTNKAGRRKGGDSFYCIMPRYSKYMLRKWEARVPLPPQPEGPKPTSPTSHESAPTTRLEATLGGGASSTPALKVPRSAARNAGLGRAEGAARPSGEGACASRRKLAEPTAGSAEPRAASSPPWQLCPGRFRSCHPNSSSLLGTVTPGKAFSKGALHPCRWGHFSGGSRPGPPLPLSRLP